MFKELFTESVSWKGSTTGKNEIESLINSYDLYTSRIESYKQLQKAEEKNKRILAELQRKGVTEFTKGGITIKVGK